MASRDQIPTSQAAWRPGPDTHGPTASGKGEESRVHPPQQQQQQQQQSAQGVEAHLLPASSHTPQPEMPIEWAACGHPERQPSLPAPCNWPSGHTGRWLGPSPWPAQSPPAPALARQLALGAMMPRFNVGNADDDDDEDDVAAACVLTVSVSLCLGQSVNQSVSQPVSQQTSLAATR